MTDIDYEEVYLTIQLGSRTRASLYKHMRDFLITEICAKGFAAEDPALFDMLTIESKAMELGQQVERYVAETDPDLVIIRTLSDNLETAVADVKAEFLDEATLDGLDALIATAGGAPIVIAGTGHSVPGRDPDA